MNFQFSIFNFHTEDDIGFTPAQESHGHEPVDEWSRFTKRIDNKSRGRKPMARGFTLIETIVALAVILAAVTGPVTLITRGIFNFSFSKNKIIANNLAQEGLELVRAIRDNNVLCDARNGAAVQNWNTGLVSSMELSASPNAVLTLSCGAATIITPNPTSFSGQFLKYDTNPANQTFGLYNYETGNNTIFTRHVAVQLPPDSPDSDIPATDQMDVIVRIEWQERNITGNFTQCPTIGSRCVTVRERLYNWR